MKADRSSATGCFAHEGLVAIAGIPYLPELPRLLGYPGQEKCVAFFLCSRGFCWADGTGQAGRADLFAWEAYSRNRVNLQYPRGYPTLEDDWPSGYWMLADDLAQRLYFGTATKVLRALGWPLPESLASDPMGTVSELVEAAMVPNANPHVKELLQARANAYGRWMTGKSRAHRLAESGNDESLPMTPQEKAAEEEAFKLRRYIQRMTGKFQSLEYKVTMKGKKRG